MECGKSY